MLNIKEIKNKSYVESEESISSGNWAELGTPFQGFNKEITQTWIEKNYPNKEKVEEIILDNHQLVNCKEKELIISGYPNLLKITKGFLAKRTREERLFASFEDKEVKNITKLVIENCPNLKIINIDSFENNQELILRKLPNLTNLFCYENNLTELDLSGCPSLRELDFSSNRITNIDLRLVPKLRKLRCFFNKLKFIDLTSNDQLEEIVCYNNCIEEINLPLSLNNLKKLEIHSNSFSEQNLSLLSNLFNLEQLDISGNNFIGSLSFLKSMTRLNHLNIINTGIDSGLEYLPDSLEKLNCSDNNKVSEELEIYGWNLEAWKEAHPDLMIKAWGKERKNLYDCSPRKIISLSIDLTSRESEKENINISQVSYQNFSLRDNRPFSWEINQGASQKELPPKLYNIKENKVERTINNNSIKSYAILSYVWGDNEDESLKENIKINFLRTNQELEEKDLIFTKWSKKALFKATKFLEFIKYSNIDYLWMDQLCINQYHINEMNQEVPKMGQYYGNAEVTLIPINLKVKKLDDCKDDKKSLSLEVLKKIVNSEWFQRSWTFQEGLLSKQTIFMFDDALVDGRIMAQIWSSLNKSSAKITMSKNERLNRNPEMFITPLGWTYCGERSDLLSQTKLSFIQSLKAIKNRKRAISIDGIYSILGLLPYGSKIIPEYKIWGEKYSKEELDKILFDVMNDSIEENYLEPLLWFGPRRSEVDLWLIPKIDENGSTNVDGVSSVKVKPKIIEINGRGIRLFGTRHIVSHLINSDYCGRYDDSGGSFSFYDGMDDIFMLWGCKETTEKIKLGDTLVIPSDEKGTKAGIAILIPKENNFECPIDIFEVSKEGKMRGFFQSSENYSAPEEEFFIDFVEKRIIELEDWGDIDYDFFDEELVNEWKKRGLGYKDAYEWTTSLDFGPNDFKLVSNAKSEGFTTAISYGIFLTKWSHIHPSITRRLQEEWESKGFDHQQTEEWINVGLNIEESNFAYWLKQENYLPEKFYDEDLKKEMIALKKEKLEFFDLLKNLGNEGINKDLLFKILDDFNNRWENLTSRIGSTNFEIEGLKKKYNDEKNLKNDNFNNIELNRLSIEENEEELSASIEAFNNQLH